MIQRPSNSIFFLSALALMFACNRKSTSADAPSVWNKVKIDFSRIDENGLAGPPDGKVAVNYEFCIPAEEKLLSEVKKIDSSIQPYKGSKGRVGCQSNQWLLIGSTHQKNHRRVIYELAKLPYVQQIHETYFE
ncbi:MAG: hypothetical protein KIS77_04485 [Saprospiraceae bacterium]|nr:hypothetical protein [Saprospiraceae bacterium]